MSNLTGGAVANIDPSSLKLRHSSELDIIDSESNLCLIQSDCLVGIKNRAEQAQEQSRQEKIDVKRHEQVRETRTEWIPSRDTITSAARKKTSESRKRGDSASEKGRAVLSRGKMAPAVLHSRHFYLRGGACLDKAQTIFLDSSVKPPPIIPSCLKIPEVEARVSSKEWLKRHSLAALKINLARWERRVTPGKETQIFHKSTLIF